MQKWKVYLYFSQPELFLDTRSLHIQITALVSNMTYQLVLKKRRGKMRWSCHCIENLPRNMCFFYLC